MYVSSCTPYCLKRSRTFATLFPGLIHFISLALQLVAQLRRLADLLARSPTRAPGDVPPPQAEDGAPAGAGTPGQIGSPQGPGGWADEAGSPPLPGDSGSLRKRPLGGFGAGRLRRASSRGDVAMALGKGNR
jgi:hypothetical protein